MPVLRCLRDAHMIVSRLLSCIGKVPLDHVLAGDEELVDQSRLDLAYSQLRQSQLWIRAGQPAGPPGLINPPSPRALVFDDADLAYDANPASLRRLADEGGLVIASLPRHQLIEGQDRWSDIEPHWARSADVVLEVRWSGFDDPSHDAYAELAVLKNRRGLLTVAALEYQGFYSRFIDRRPG